MRKAHNHRRRRRTIALSDATKLTGVLSFSLLRRYNPWPILNITLSLQLLCAIKNTPYLFYLLRHDLSFSFSLCAAQQLSNLSIAESGDSSFFLHFFCFSETVLCRSNTHRHKAVVRLLARGVLKTFFGAGNRKITDNSCFEIEGTQNQIFQ